MDLEVTFGSETSGNKPVFVAGTTVRGVVKVVRGNKRDTRVIKTHVKMQVVGILGFNPQFVRLNSGCYVKELPPTTTTTITTTTAKFLSKDQQPLHPTLGMYERLVFASPVYDVIPDETPLPQSSPFMCKKQQHQLKKSV